METTKIVLWLLAICAAIALFLHWTNKLDDARQKQYAEYEACVVREYGGRTPTQIYLETGEYPGCVN
jgi:hypothetical protein